ncbi:MAG: hypothetical protein ABR598_06650 [Candidatus Dormibacteria bacterium]
MHVLVAYPQPDITSLSVVIDGAGTLVGNIGQGIIEDSQRADWARLGAAVVPHTPLAGAIAQLSDATPIGATTFQCGETWAQGHPFFGSPAVLWVTTGSSWADAIHFWNHRAVIRGPLNPGPVAFATPEVCTDRAFIDTFTGSISRHPSRFRPDVFVWSR